MTADGWRIRAARPGEHEALTALVFRSVQEIWGYDDEFMAWEPEAIVITPEHITLALTSVLEREGEPLGVVVLSGMPPEMELSRLMVAPEAAGDGWGRRLWEHAVATAREQGATALRLDADPNAEPFYRHMGAVTTGELDLRPPMLPDWRIKTMRYTIPAERDTGAASDGEA